MEDNIEKPDFESIIEKEAQGRYPVTETTGDIYVGSKTTFKHGARYGFSIAQSRILELEKEKETLNSLMLSGEKRGHDKAQEHYKSEISELKAEIERLKKGPGLLNKE